MSPYPDGGFARDMALASIVGVVVVVALTWYSSLPPYPVIAPAEAGDGVCTSIRGGLAVGTLYECDVREGYKCWVQGTSISCLVVP